MTLRTIKFVLGVGWLVLYLLNVTSSLSANNVTFREAASMRGILMGSNGNSDHFTHDITYNTMLSQQYSLIYPENECLFQTIRPSQDIFNFTKCETVLNFTIENNQSFAADHLIWGVYNPSWLINGNFTPIEKENILINHINTTMKYFGNSAYSWNVVNEAINDSIVIDPITGKNTTDVYKHNVWYPDIPNYVELAFTAANAVRESNYEKYGQTKLFYNDYLITQSDGKTEAVYNMIKSLLDKNVSIDGIGFETHISILSPVIYDDIVYLLNKFVDLGITVHISEMDVACGIPTYKNNNKSWLPCIDWDSKKQEKQAKYFQTVLKACLDVDGCDFFSTWGFTDKYTWITTEQHPLIWDQYYNPKDAYDSILQQLLDYN